MMSETMRGQESPAHRPDVTVSDHPPEPPPPPVDLTRVAVELITQDDGVISEIEPFISTNTVAEMFEVTNETVRNWIAAGKIKAFKVGPVYRLRKKDVIDFANEHYGN